MDSEKIEFQLTVFENDNFARIIVELSITAGLSESLY
jgi:hypothetical protein